ncbi:hypothetical protein M758_1G253400 [Ceratodon purpureus]|nr:hypothetical protein M758_1G253400 [Ceratodon purpureus]
MSQDEADCSLSYDPRYPPVYDPRVRPWFVQSTYVHKAVALLIDSGAEMRKPGNTEILPGTNLNKAISLALRFLDTLSVVQGREDYVNIMDFSGHGTYRWLNNFKTSTYNKTRDNQNFSVALDGIVGDNIDVSSSPSAADTTNAINIAISELKKIPDVVQVVIVLTASGQNLSNLDITANSGVNLFVYNFGVTAGESQCNQTIRAFSEFIPVERLDNPLYALESYYSFLAKVHASFIKINYNETIDYGPECPDFTGVDNSTLTMSRAAFDLNGELLGVVGIDFFQNKVNLQYSTFKFSDIVSYVNKYSPNISSAGNISVCFTPYTLKDNCKDFKDSVPDFLCQLSTGDDKIGCCGECKEKEVWRKIVGGVAGGIVGLLMIAVIVYFAWRCITRRMKSEKVLAESPQFIFPGPENGTTLQGDTRENFGVKTPE